MLHINGFKMYMLSFVLSSTFLIHNALEDDTFKQWLMNPVIAVELAVFNGVTIISAKVVLSITQKKNKTTNYLG